MWFAKTETGKYFDLCYEEYIDNVLEEMGLNFSNDLEVDEINGEVVDIYNTYLYINDKNQIIYNNTEIYCNYNEIGNPYKIIDAYGSVNHKDYDYLILNTDNEIWKIVETFYGDACECERYDIIPENGKMKEVSGEYIVSNAGKLYTRYFDEGLIEIELPLVGEKVQKIMKTETMKFSWLHNITVLSNQNNIWKLVVDDNKLKNGEMDWYVWKKMEEVDIEKYEELTPMARLKRNGEIEVIFYCQDDEDDEDDEYIEIETIILPEGRKAKKMISYFDKPIYANVFHGYVMIIDNFGDVWCVGTVFSRFVQ